MCLSARMRRRVNITRLTGAQVTGAAPRCARTLLLGKNTLVFRVVVTAVLWMTVLRHLLVALFKAKSVQPAARICSARALQLWIGRQQRLDAVDDIRRGRDDVVDASTPN